MAPANDNATARNGGAAHNTPDRSTDMVHRNEQGTQAKITSFRWARGHAHAVIEITYPTTTRTMAVAISATSEGRALSLMNAIARLELGAVVMDGYDFRAIHDSLDSARGLSSELAPEHTAATLAIGAIEQTQRRLAGVVS